MKRGDSAPRVAGWRKAALAGAAPLPGVGGPSAGRRAAGARTRRGARPAPLSTPTDC